jgi:RNA polymerase sigma factor (TIGR02999 family)
MSTATDVTQILFDWEAGDTSALDRLIPLVSEELHQRAERLLRRERAGHTLQPTALVHEAYLRLVDQKRAGWQNRAHFFAVSARIMRRILVDHARRRRAAKRGDGAVKVPLDEALGAAVEPEVDLLVLEDALERLAAAARRPCRVVELRYFGGLTLEETATVLEVSVATVKLDWQMARAWLYRELRGPAPRGG